MKSVILGAGYVGLTLGVVAASSGHEVQFVENNKSRLDLIKLGKSHFYEPGINEEILKHTNSKKIKAFEKISEILIPNDNSPIIYVISLGTPLKSESDEDVSNPIFNLIKNEIIPILRNQDVICLRSTVEIGFCDHLLQNTPHKLNLAFCPERTVEGKALIELMELPQIIATDNDYTYDVCKSFFKFSPEFIRINNYREGEAVKLICNTYRDWIFSFSNLCSMIGEEKKINISSVISAANFSYSRNVIPMPGLVGGPCLEKDPIILSLNLSKNISKLVKTSREINLLFFESKMKEFFPYVSNKYYESKRIMLIGAAFKGQPLTNDTRGSYIYNILKFLLNLGVPEKSISVFDPLVKELEGYENINIINDLDYLYSSDYDFYLLNTNHQIFYSNSFKKFLSNQKNKIKTFWPEFDMN